MFEFVFVQSEENVVICQLTEQQDAVYKKLSFEDFSADNVDICFIDHLEEELLQKVGNYMFQFPIIPISKTDITAENFEQLNYEQGINLYRQIVENWVLNNNVSLIEELYGLTDHLKELWHQDRITFFEEFWSLIKRNLGTTELNIIFNDLDKGAGPGGKDKLIQSKIFGRNQGNFEKGGEIEDKLMDHYKANFEHYLELIEFNQQKGEIVLTAQINQSPILVMAKSKVINQLQLTLLKTLIEGISRK